MIWAFANSMETGNAASGDTPNNNFIFDWEVFGQELQARGYGLCKKDYPGYATTLQHTAKDASSGQEDPVVQRSALVQQNYE